jgi:hypothetical protein
VVRNIWYNVDEVRKITMKGLIKGQKGQALVVALIVLVIGGLILTPLLGLMGTGIKSGQVFEQKVDETYAADAGVEDAMWHIRNNDIDEDDLLREVLGAGYNHYYYSSDYSYVYDLDVDDKDVKVTMQNVWIPKDISQPTAQTAKQIIDDAKLTIVGYPSSSNSTYVIKIVWNGTGTALKVKTIGLWLSPGFQYDGLNGTQLPSGSPSPGIAPYKGGTAVVWNFTSPPSLSTFPVGASGPPMVKTVTFKYTGPEGQIPELVSSWIDTTGVTGITYTWDDSIRLYKILSQAGTVQIEAYGAPSKFRKLKSTISSDYTVAGNTLLTTLSGNPATYRDKLLAESQGTITRTSLQSIPPSGIVPAGKIPEEATIDKVYLYWSGWIDYHYWQSAWPYTYREIPALKYSSNTKAQLIANSQVNMVKFAVGGSAQTVTANISGVHGKEPYVVPDVQITNADDCIGSADSWEYSCFRDVTNLVVSGNTTVQQYIENAMKTAGSGNVTFTLGEADALRGVHRPESSPYPGAYANYYFPLSGDGSTGYPLATPAFKSPADSSYDTEYQWAYAGWSLIIFYNSPALIQRQLYLYDNIITVPYHSGGAEIDKLFPVGNFLAPPVISDNDKSHITYFVGEGDYESIYSGSKVKVNSNWLSDPHGNPEEDVLNSYSSGVPITNTDGVDIDTFVLPTGCILPYATSATVTLASTIETYTLVYLVLSFRSELTTGGVITNYQIKIS